MIYFVYFTLVLYFSSWDIYAQEIVKPTDIVDIGGLSYKKNASSPYSGKVEGKNKKGSYESGSYLNGKKSGVWTEFWRNGQLFVKSGYIDGEWHGVWERYHYNGFLREVGKHQKGQRSGLWKWYDETGSLISQATYIN